MQNRRAFAHGKEKKREEGKGMKGSIVN
jgi:hypothetical protein